MITFSDLTDKLTKINFSEYKTNNLYKHYTTLDGLINILKSGKIKCHIAKGDDDFDILNIGFDGHKNPCRYINKPVVCFTAEGYDTGIQSFLGDKTDDCIGYLLVNNTSIVPTIDYISFIPNFVMAINLKGITEDLLKNTIVNHDWKNSNLKTLKDYISEHEYNCPFDYSTDAENYFMFWLFANYLKAIPESKSMKIIEFRTNEDVSIKNVIKIVLTEKLPANILSKIKSFGITIEERR